MFLNFIDELTPWHLRILQYFENPKTWLAKREINVPNWSFDSQRHVFDLAFPELKAKKELTSQLLRDLASRGLSIEEHSMNIGVSMASIFRTLITDLGRQFLGFIISPD